MKEGPLFIHRTKGKGPLASSSFKKLYFSLTTEALSFAKTSSSKVSEQEGFLGWCLFVGPAIGRWKQEAQDVKSSLNDIDSSKPERDPVSKQNGKQDYSLLGRVLTGS